MTTLKKMMLFAMLCFAVNIHADPDKLKFPQVAVAAPFLVGAAYAAMIHPENARLLNSTTEYLGGYVLGIIPCVNLMIDQKSFPQATQIGFNSGVVSCLALLLIPAAGTALSCLLAY